MTKYEQLRRFLEDLRASVCEAVLLMEEDRATRLLSVITDDLVTLERLLEEWKPLAPSIEPRPPWPRWIRGPERLPENE